MDLAPDAPRPEDEAFPPKPAEQQAEQPVETQRAPDKTPELETAPVPEAVAAEPAAQEPVAEGTETPATEGESPAPVQAVPDTATPDAATPDAATPDAATPDTVTSDTETPDTETPDTETPDTATPDATDAQEEGAPAAETEAPTDTSAEAGPEGATKQKGQKKAGAGKGKKRKPPRKRAPPRHVEPPLPPELKQEAKDAALARVVAQAQGSEAGVLRALEQLQSGLSISFLARFRRPLTGGMDERRLHNLKEGWHEILQEEERRTGIRALLKKRDALNEQTAAALENARSIAAMEDLAAPYLPVNACRATMARGRGLQGLADAIRAATDAAIPLSELTKPFVPEGAEPTALDAALGGARDILAEELTLDVELRARLRDLFYKKATLSVSARTDKRGKGKSEGQTEDGADAPSGEAAGRKGRGGKPHAGKPHGGKGSLIGFKALASKVPPIKMLAIRRAEKQRQVVTVVEPPEEKALEIVHRKAVPTEQPHAGILRAAAEDGYRRILKPMLQNELRLEMKRRADEHAMEQFERSLRNLLLGPYAGPRRTLGLRPDVMNGHRWCVIDESGKAAGSGQLPHEPTAGREACLTEFTDVLKTYEVSAIAVGTSGGRADAVALARAAVKDLEEKVSVTEVADGGTRTLEAMGPLEFENHLVVAPECRGALSLARRFQDPLTELVHVDPKALALGPHLHEVHQGRLRGLLDWVVESCLAHAGIDPNKADADLLAHVPGFSRKTAQAFMTWREGQGPLTSKAQLATIEGVGPEVAEQAVGFLRIAGAADPRDRTQMHPEQYEVAEKMAAHLEVDLETLFSSPEVRQRIRPGDLADSDTSLASLKHVLYEASFGQSDPRPVFTAPIPPPPHITLDTIAPGLVLQGQVIRAAPFGIFLEVGLGLEALIPIPHIGDRPGQEQSQVAPVGAVINARVLEIEKDKKRLTLSMRREAPARAAGARGRGREPAGGGRPPRQGDRGPRDGRQGGGARGGARDDARGGQRVGAAQGRGGQRVGDAQGRSGGQRSQAGGQRPQGGARQGERSGARSDGRGGRSGGRDGKGGRSGGGGFSGGRGGRRDQHERGVPRTISLQPEDPMKDVKQVDESKLTPEQLMQRKLDEMKRRLQGPG